MNKDDGGGKKPGGSGRGKHTGNPAAHKGGEKGGKASASRSAAERSASAKKAAATRKRNAEKAARTWMNDIYPLCVEAAGVMIITPVNWYATSSPIKLMMDRLVCADGGNPDPTLTGGKDAARAKQVELDGWDYPRHLAGRLFSVVVHGDVEGAENVRRSLSDWLRFMKLMPAGPEAELDRYIGYWKPYATNHEELDQDSAMIEEVRNAARALAEGVAAQRAGRLHIPGAHLAEARSK